MKKIKIVSLFALFVCANPLYSQGTDYYEGITSVCYGGECYVVGPSGLGYRIRNAKNVMSTEILSWRVDGKPRESEEFSPYIEMISKNQLLRAFVETFTVGEIEALKDEKEVMLIGFYVNPVNGTVSEVSFSVNKERFAPIVTPDKIYMLEKLLKNYVTFDTSDPRNLKYNYIAMTTLYKFKFAWDYIREHPTGTTKLSTNYN